MTGARIDYAAPLRGTAVGSLTAALAVAAHGVGGGGLPGGAVAAQLTELRRQCVGEHSVEDCGIVHGLATMETVAPAAKRSHLG